MTVEQPPLLQTYENNQDRTRGENHDIQQIREVTGITDVSQIKEAIRVCCNKEGIYDVSEVVHYLCSDQGKIIQQETTPHKVVENKQRQAVAVAPVTYSDRGVGTNDEKTQPKNSGEKNQVIDLTTEPAEDDLQLAIAASLMDTQGILGGQISKEEQDISRVLEASLAESKAGTKRKRGDIWFVDPLNPHERKRKSEWPVGLKNVGNTCWFSAVIQSLFHLPIFRQLVLTFMPVVDGKPGTSVESRNLRFMQELRQLFALMVGSHRKYVDPSKSVDILKEAFSSPDGSADSQQDVSEFQHKLLEWLEDAFQTSDSRATSPVEDSGASGDADDKARSKNPMQDLFYGQVTSEGVNEGNHFSRCETFGQFPLQVDGFRDIHESLDAAMAQGEIETVSGDPTLKSGQEQWFTRLPPVLTFELSRFQFNQSVGRPEKIHNKLHFPQTIYMDRYMECNKHVTRQRREQVKALKEELLNLQKKLDRFIDFGSGPKRFPLQDVLQYALEFAQTKTDRVEESTDVEMESPRSSTVTESPNTSPSKNGSQDVAMVTGGSPCQQVPMTPTKLPDVVVPTPAPRFVSESELQVLESCLHRWRTEVESDVKELQDSINSLDDSISQMYTDEAMRKFPYRLHAVLVHEGQAASGHYWAYIYSPQRSHWLKFNDITVTEASWDELEKEGFGGYHNASAYCLMYVDENREELMQETQCGVVSVDTFADDLKEVVRVDNANFAKEIEEWDKKQHEKTDPDVTIVGEKRGGAVKPGTSNAIAKQVERASIAVIHAQLSYQATVKAIRKVVSESQTYDKKGPESAMLEAANGELSRLELESKQLALTLPKKDARLMHIVIYLLANGADIKFVTHRVILEQFLHTTFPDTNVKAHSIRQAAGKKLHDLVKRAATMGMDKAYVEWHEDYKNYRKTVIHFVLGVEAMYSEKFSIALQHLHYAYFLNRHLLRKGPTLRGFDSKIVAYFQRQCLLSLSESALVAFESDANLDDTLVVMNTFLLPCLPVLFQTGFEDDTQAAEDIRDKWCSILGQEVEGEKMEKLSDILARLFDCETPTDAKMCLKAPTDTIKENSELIRRYSNIMEVSDTQGYLEAAKLSK